MTVKEFSKKYGVDYATVYNSTWLTKTRPDTLVNKQYVEEELLNAVRVTAIGRVNRLTAELNRAQDILKKVTP